MSNVIDFTSRREEIVKKQNLHLSETFREHFGSWDDWSNEVIMYLLNELTEGHWKDSEEGEDKVQRFVIAYAGLSIALMANDETKNRSELVANIINNFWVITDYLGCTSTDDNIDPKAREIFDAIWAMCKPHYATANTKPLVATMLELMKTRRCSVNELARHLNQSEGWVRSAITQLRRRGHKIVNYPADQTFGFEEGIAPPLGPVGVGDGRWKRLA